MRYILGVFIIVYLACLQTSVLQIVHWVAGWCTEKGRHDDYRDNDEFCSYSFSFKVYM